MKFSARAFAQAIAPRLNPSHWVVCVMSKARGWTVDRQREVRIRDLRLRMHAAHRIGNRRLVALLGAQMFAQCELRSPEQVARMERRLLARMDPHARLGLGK